MTVMKIAELLKSLSEASVGYVLVGGLAVQLHGYMRSTFDIDLVLAMNDENLCRFIEVAKRLGMTPVMPVDIDALRDSRQIEQWHREKGMLAFALRESRAGGNVIDVLVRPEISYERLLEHAVAAELSGNTIRIASIDDLMLMKRAANRPKDRLDIEALEKILRGEDPNA